MDPTNLYEATQNKQLLWTENQKRAIYDALPTYKNYNQNQKII